MTRTTMTRVTIALAMTIVTGVALSGCAPKTSAPAAKPAGSAPAADTVGRMSADQKRSMIASNFPIEVPVPQGNVVRGEAQGQDVWIYQLEIPASAADVANWYLTWYPKAEWQLASDEPVGEGRRLVLVKGGYAADVTVTSAGSNATKVTAIVGVGDPILNTQ